MNSEVANYQGVVFLSYAILSILVLLILLSRLRRLRKIEFTTEQEKEQLAITAKRAEIIAMEIQTKAELERQEKIAATEIFISERKKELQKIEETSAKMQTHALELSLKADERAEKLKLETERLHKSQKELDEILEKYKTELLQLSTLSESEAKEKAIELISKTSTEEARIIRNNTLQQTAEDIEKEANRLLLDTMQRIAPKIIAENALQLVPIPSEDIKGKIIGREGRNIKAFEQTTGVTLIIDETPGFVLISCYEPFRREVAALTLKKIIEDGRIHPQNIEHFYQIATNDVTNNAIECGTRVCDELNLFNVQKKVRELLGHLRFHRSLSQNTLQHSIEVAKLCGLFAVELNLNVDTATRAGLFHDIGKAYNIETEETHAKIGARILKQAGENVDVQNAVESHHHEVVCENIYGALIILADSISAARPGARTSSQENYIERIKRLEQIAKQYPGVIETYALQAGREIRIIVSSEKVSDIEATLLAQKIRLSIEENLVYPGTIKIVVIREFRALEEAK